MNRCFLVLALGILTTRLYAQNHAYFPVMPTTPEVASLEKMNEIPVNLHTGIPNINIPITTVSDGTLSSSVSLSYHASGIKVEDQASSVGLGWSLNAGGIIHRTVRGLPDESPNGWLNNGLRDYTYHANVFSYNGQDRFFKTVFEEIENGNLDSEPDLFTFSVGSISGKFLFDKNKEIVFVEDYGLSIVHSQEPVTGKFKQFILRDATGKKYFFGTNETGARTAFLDQQTVWTPCYSEGGVGGSIDGAVGEHARTGWYLLEVTSLSEFDQIDFYYEARETETCILESETAYSPPVPDICHPMRSKHCYSYSKYFEKVLQAVASRKDSVAFMRATNREDLLSDKSLDEIKIFYQGVPIKDFVLSYDYFHVGNVQTNYCDQYLSTEERSKRLKLQELTEYSPITDETNPPFKFEYNAMQLPDYFSKARDHWGYYNGATSNSSLVPSIRLSPTIATPGADLSSRLAHSKAAVLEKLTYPNGQEIALDYELNSIETTEIIDVNVDPEYEIYFANIQSNGADTYYEKEFEIDHKGSPSIEVNLTVDIMGISCLMDEEGTIRLDCGIAFEIKGVTDPTYLVSVNGVDNFSLPVGTYKLVVEVSGDPSDDALAHFNYSVHWRIPKNISLDEHPEGETVERVYTYHLGGLRVKRLTFKDGVAGIERYTDYLYSDAVLSSYPVYDYTVYNAAPVAQAGEGTCSYKAISSVSQARGGLSNYITYNKVEELFRSKSESYGKKISHFDNKPDHFISTLPFPPIDERRWEKGNIRKEEVFDETNKLLQLTDYHNHSHQLDSVLGIKVVNILFGFPLQRFYEWEEYKVSSGINQLLEQTAITYNRSVEDTLGMRMRSTHEYLPHKPYLIHRTHRYLLDDVPETIETLYAEDLNDSPVKDALLANNAVGVPLSTIRKRDGAITSVDEIRYGLVNGKPLPVSRVELRNNTNKGADYSQLVDSMQLLEAYHYDDDGNLSYVSSRDGTFTTFLWSDDRRIQGVVKNATPDQVYYNGFESDGSSGEAKTGQRSMDGERFTIPLADRPEGEDLMVSYWYFEGSKWHFRQASYPESGIITQPGAERMDELRVHPRNAMMTTYTYSVFGKVAARTDENSNSTYYTYDGFGRLETTKSDQKDIRQMTHYELK